MCGTKNFASVRLYSAPQLHLTIVVILGICAYGTPKQVESRFHTVSASCRTGGEAFGGPSKSEPPSPAPAIAAPADGGAGVRYAVVYKANRDQIRNPNRIYPGQIFVLPMKARERAGQNH